MTNRTEAQRKWRQSTDAKKVEVYLAPELVDHLDKFVRAKGYRGRGEALATLIRKDARRQLKQPAVKVLHVERTWDLDRCEFRNASGSRCKRKTAVIVKRKVGGKVLEFGACKHHEYKSEPHPSVV